MLSVLFFFLCVCMSVYVCVREAWLLRNVWNSFRIGGVFMIWCGCSWLVRKIGWHKMNLNISEFSGKFPEYSKFAIILTNGNAIFSIDNFFFFGGGSPLLLRSKFYSSWLQCHKSHNKHTMDFIDEPILKTYSYFIIFF